MNIIFFYSNFVLCFRGLEKQFCPCSKVRPEVHEEWEAKHSRRKRRFKRSNEDTDLTTKGHSEDTTRRPSEGSSKSNTSKEVMLKNKTFSDSITTMHILYNI
jgi:hypothetical protein